MIKTKGIDHVCLWVRSLSEAKNYYEKIFEFVCELRTDDETTLTVESDFVHFFIRESKNNNEFISKQHISFEVDSLEEVILSLKALGVSGLEVGNTSVFKNRNYKWCEWRDPSGIRLECVEVL